jgi:WD40 repeat protein
MRQFPPGAALVATFSADGERVYVVDRTGLLQTLDRRTLSDVATAVPVGVVTTMGARGDVVVVLRGNGSVLRVRPETGEIVSTVPAGTLSNPEDAPNDASPDGRLLATADAEGRMRLLDLETVEWLGTDARADTLADAGGWVAFAPDGHQFAALQSNRIGLWDGHTGAYQGSLPLPDLATSGSIRYLPDSSGLLIAARDGRTWTADTGTDAWPERACAIAGRNLTQAQWTRSFPSRDYHATCPQWPPGA